jgi:hypothetical protein
MQHGHVLDPGVVVISVVQTGNSATVLFTGVGTGWMGGPNDYFAPDVWGLTITEMKAWAWKNQ